MGIFGETIEQKVLIFGLCALLGIILLAGCVPTLIGAVAYKTSKTKDAKERFIENFNQTNFEREKAGLPPLDLCTEKYHFDKNWADDDPICKERISRYEAGDKAALGHPVMPSVAEEPPQSEPGG